MSIVVNGKELNDAINYIIGIVGKNCEFLNIEYEKTLMHLSAMSDTQKVKMTIPATCNGKGHFATNLNILYAICVNRGDLEFKLGENTVSFKAVKGKYAGKVNQTPYTPIEVVTASVKEEQRSIGGEIKKSLFELVELVSIKPSFGETTSLNLLIRANKKKLTIACADNYHAAVLTCPSEKKFKLDIPSTYITELSRIAKDKKSIGFGIDGGNIYMWNDTVQVALPMVDVEDRPFEQIETLEGLYGKSTSEFIVHIPTLTQALSNINAVFETGCAVVATPSKASLEVSCSTVFGEIKDNLKIETIKTDGKPINWEMITLSDALDCIGDGEVTVRFHGIRFSSIVKKVGKASVTYYLNSVSEK